MRRLGEASLALIQRCRAIVRRTSSPQERLTTETIPLLEQPNASVSKLAEELFLTHNRIFAGLDKEMFVRYLFHSGATATKMRIYRCQSGALVGYAVVHRYRKIIKGTPTTIFRAEAGFLPQYRAHGRTIFFYALEFLKYLSMHPTENIFYLGMLVHPSSYVVFARNLDEMYPKGGREIPEDTYRLMVDMADAFAVPPVDPADPLIRNILWRTREEKPYWRCTNDPDVVFFRNRNPGYRLGHGLVVLVPMTIPNLVRSLVMYAYKQVKQRL